MNKVIVTIVTFNRKNDLENCLFALSKQTYKKFDILVVNNGSTDGTKEYLDEQENIVVIHQENLGGAGGFYAGMKYMFEHNYEWLWMMDDDGLPENKQLEELIKFGEKGNFVLNAIVLDKDDHSQLAFCSKISSVSLYKEILTKQIFHPFNGTFIHRSVIANVGFIKKEMFIWGDEQEYIKRIIENGYSPTTVTTAIHYHPKEKGKRLYVLPLKTGKYILEKPKQLSKIYYRNLGYINRVYRNHWYTGVGTVVWFIVALGWRLQFTELFKFLKYYYRGFNQRFDD